MKRYALISVSDKNGIVDFAKKLENLGFEIVSSGGTFKVLKDAGLNPVKVSDITGFPEILDGRVKTLHPKIHGGILVDMRKESHREELKKHGINNFEIVCVNLYPFKETVKKTDDVDEIIENIDIGGPTLLRASAKNFYSVAVVVDPDDYSKVVEEIEKNGEVSLDTRKKLALKALSHTASYDIAISSFFNRMLENKFPERLFLEYNLENTLRYGENPHQQAAFYSEPDFRNDELPALKKLQGKELSYNNLMDSDAAIEMVREFDEPACVIVKHANPCGIGRDNESLKIAFERAHSTDPMSAFGGIIALNREVDGELASLITKNFVEVVIAPSFTKEARGIFSKKKNLRLIQLPINSEKYPYFNIKRVRGGILLQDADTIEEDRSNWNVVTEAKPDEETFKALEFAWKVVKHVKSNAIVFCKENETLGIGAGQMSRVDSVKIAVMKANKDLNGSVLASDAFFPFRDSIDEAAKIGVKAVIQPGGSIRDKEVIEAANEHGIAMVFTGIRHFRH
ncbi:phosphoribosylaminoimidazolecarboxamide formyltransferase / IMP cyclohydrolase [Thermotomaculum hydrothermale]|uniref:Bifunctional purine biosynthesis protein PurH n=1 Tax=Thermotomaculum hydrothermale TaxID=981385 RepID=A0A7R6PH49_9BACT|nr:bifunctional phosphoribosylaminoimidazolecarboxamide formyltransferase/IMP cyclohydrolase [Thermotomaculum hydrothermale]BBB33648.1 phosphoribosylaminoimidazolecarboxamide formyltransferase / IMP cyclohydrolase [Thermotomaculum hydrothermale]